MAIQGPTAPNWRPALPIAVAPESPRPLPDGRQCEEPLWLFVGTCTAPSKTWLLRIGAEGE